MSRVQRSKGRAEARTLQMRADRAILQEMAWQEAKRDVYGRLAAIWDVPGVQVAAGLATTFLAVFGATRIG